MLWASKRKRANIRLLGYLVLAFAVLFPIGIFSGEHLRTHSRPLLWSVRALKRGVHMLT